MKKLCTEEVETIECNKFKIDSSNEVCILTLEDLLYHTDSVIKYALRGNGFKFINNYGEELILLNSKNYGDIQRQNYKSVRLVRWMDHYVYLEQHPFNSYYLHIYSFDKVYYVNIGKVLAIKMLTGSFTIQDFENSKCFKNVPTYSRNSNEDFLGYKELEDAPTSLIKQIIGKTYIDNEVGKDMLDNIIDKTERLN